MRYKMEQSGVSYMTYRCPLPLPPSPDASFLQRKMLLWGSSSSGFEAQEVPHKLSRLVPSSLLIPSCSSSEEMDCSRMEMFLLQEGGEMS